MSRSGSSSTSSNNSCKLDPLQILFVLHSRLPSLVCFPFQRRNPFTDEWITIIPPVDARQGDSIPVQVPRPARQLRELRERNFNDEDECVRAGRLIPLILCGLCLHVYGWGFRCGQACVGLSAQR